MNKTYVTDVQKFCQWIAPLMQCTNVVTYPIALSSLEVLYYLAKERNRVENAKRRKKTIKSYDSWAKVNP